MKDSILEIQVNESDGLIRDQENITQGLPFPKGLIFDSSKILFIDETDKAVPMAATPLSTWNDGSIKWMLFDFQVSMDAYGIKTIKIVYDNNEIMSEAGSWKDLVVVESPGKIVVKAGNAVFYLDTTTFYPFKQISYNNSKILKENSSCLYIKDHKDEILTPIIDSWRVESRNELHLVLLFEGHFVSDNDAPILQYKSRIHFYPSSTVSMDFSLLNPFPARHFGGVWDLGDENSFLFKCFNLDLVVSGEEQLINYSVGLSDDITFSAEDITIYQDSSGGKNWKSINHVNRNGENPLSFKGYQVETNAGVIKKGNRSTPVLGVSEQGKGLCVTLKHFWQNFPKCLQVKNNVVRLGIFPDCFNDLHELQGGEQKKHTVYLFPFKGPLKKDTLKSVHSPLRVRIPPEWFYSSKACPKFVPVNSMPSIDSSNIYQEIVDGAVKGDLSFENRREIIDEYGWRNFGDIYADHEAVFDQKSDEFISHYNNQYDVIKGGVVQFMRSGDYSWFKLADELAGHVSDIDIYHTNKDRFQYNHGLFWHTDHHVAAATATHRTISKKHMELKDPQFVGGGPSYEHNYTTGLLYHYWLTGEQSSRESVLELADYVINGIDGPDTILEVFINTVKNVSTKLKGVKADSQDVYGFNGPGRGSGNSLNVLIDAYSLTKDEKYLKYADKLIRWCVDPNENISLRKLLNAELRWMYTIFLQSLGKYIDIKYEHNQFDDSFQFARLSLIKYAQWMLENEYPYLDKPELLEFPNETWAAQDIRKADILAHTAVYVGEPLKTMLMKKSRFFLESSMKQLKTFDTSYFVRPVAILMSNGMFSFDMIEPACRNNILEDFDSDNAVRRKRLENNPISLSLNMMLSRVKKISVKKELRWITQRMDSKRKIL